MILICWKAGGVPGVGRAYWDDVDVDEGACLFLFRLRFGASKISNACFVSEG